MCPIPNIPDDYTRITTPRQDVLFKKGYLSRPKSYAPMPMPSDAYDDTYGGAAGGGGATGMEDVIVLTPEEAIAAGLMHGYDPEHPYVGFYDATGMFYVNREWFHAYLIMPIRIIHTCTLRTTTNRLCGNFHNNNPQPS